VITFLGGVEKGEDEAARLAWHALARKLHAEEPEQPVRRLAKLSPKKPILRHAQVV